MTFSPDRGEQPGATVPVSATAGQPWSETGVGRTGVAGVRGTLEVRWFVPGPLPASLWRPDSRPRSRVDAYHEASLRPDASLKRRGTTGPWEHKHRVAHAQVLVFGAMVVAEAWTKERRPPYSQPDGPATMVAKQIWRLPGIEVVAIDVDDERWWSVAVKLGPSQRPLRRLQPLVAAVTSEGSPRSYPSWLVDRRSVNAEDPVAASR